MKPELPEMREESRPTMKAQTIPATQFKAELWTTAGNSEIWATVMLDGSEPGSPCAFGPREKMEAHAAKLNESKGIVPC
jgi:hypothetical protein